MQSLSNVYKQQSCNWREFEHNIQSSAMRKEFEVP